MATCQRLSTIWCKATRRRWNTSCHVTRPHTARLLRLTAKRWLKCTSIQLIIMRKITQQAVRAFEAARPMKNGNTEVRVINQGGGGTLVLLQLHGNVIARHETWSGRTYITDAGWDTNTTKERLNGLYGVSISQRKGVWYLNGNEWNGAWINPHTGEKPTT